MSMLEKARVLESRIARALTRAAEHAVGPSAREPIEIVHAIVEAVEREIQSGGRGVRVFPFNRVTVSVHASSREARARLEAALSGDLPLRTRVVERLRSARCEVPDLRLEVVYVDHNGPGWRDPQFDIAFDSAAPDAVPDAAPPIDSVSARLDVTVVRGIADRRTYTFDAARIDVGRGAEVRDRRNRLLRTNHIAFVEGSTAENQTVSRRHAHIVRESSGAHRLHDDGSEHGTGIVRGGRTIVVPPGSRGVRLRSGDEVVFGDARIRVRIA